MAELAAVSSAAGIISLGLEATKGIVAYCSARKDHGKETQHVLNRLRGLENILEVLHPVLNGSDLVSRPSFQVAINSILACKEAMDDLDGIRKKCSGSTTTATLSAKLSKQITRAYYPFRKDDLRSLNCSLNDIQSNLSLAMQTVQSDQIGYMTAVLRTQHQQALGQFSSITLHTSATGHKIVQEIDQLKLQLNQLQVDKTPSLGHLVTGESSSILDEEAAPHVRRPTRDNSTKRLATRNIALDPKQCQCRPGLTYRKTWRLAYFEYRTEELSRHLPDCPFYGSIPKRQRKAVHLSLPIYGRESGQYFVLDIDIGAGNTTLRRSLTCGRVLPHSHPAFSILTDLRSLDEVGFTMSLDEVGVTMQEIRWSLREMLSNGMLWPYDTNPEGETLLHVALVEFGVNGTRIHGFRDLVKDLISAGVPSHEYDTTGLLPIDTWMLYASIEGARDNIEMLLRLGLKAEGSISRYYWEADLFEQCRTFVEELDISDYHHALVARSTRLLSDVIAANKACVQELLPSGRTGAHAAIFWPEGLWMLIAAGVDINRADQSGLMPLDLAFSELGDWDCILQLLRADCTLPHAGETFTLAHHFDQCNAVPQSYDDPANYKSPPHQALENVMAVDKLNKPSNAGGERPFDHLARRGQPVLPGAVSVLIEAVKDRRRRLRELAIENLPASVCAELSLSQDKVHVIGANAGQLLSALNDASIFVPSALVFEQSNVYSHRIKGRFRRFTSTFSVELAQRLWEEGFCDVEEQDRYSEDPIESVYWGLNGPDLAYDIEKRTAFALWFQEKRTLLGGSDTLDDCQHILAHNLGAAASLCSEELVRQLNVDTRAFLLRVFELKHEYAHTACDCACSVAGCVAIDRFFRASDACMPRWDIAQAVRFLGYLLDLDSAHSAELMPHIIRAVAFAYFRLDSLEHTCCWGPRGLSEEDAAEAAQLFQQQQKRIRRFEKLVPQLIAAHKSSGMSIVQWAEQPLLNLVDSALEAEEYMAEVCEHTGVVLEDIGSDDDDDVHATEVEDVDWSSDDESYGEAST